jgi:multidrug efflux pump subunit AcrA (membrane-fusion protein)
MSQLTPEQIQQFQQRMQQRQGQRRSGTVWVLDEATNKMKPVIIGTGITDNTFTELSRGELKEGMKVVIGTVTAGTAATPRQQMRGPGGPGGMMFIGR